MWPEWLTAVLTTLGGGGLITGLVAWRRDVKRGPIESQTAQVADAVAVSTAANQLVQTVMARLKETDDKLDQVRTVVDRWGTWYADLTAHWQVHRTKEHPPAPPAA